MVRADIASQQISTESQEELIFIRTFFKNKENMVQSFLLGTFYNSPTYHESKENKHSQGKHSRAKIICRDIENLKTQFQGNQIMFGGDLNLSPKYTENIFKATMESSNLVRLPQTPTRINKIIDHFFIPKSWLLEEKTIKTNISTDHNAIIVKLNPQGKIERIFKTIYSKKSAEKYMNIAIQQKLSLDEFFARYQMKIARTIKPKASRRFLNLLEEINQIASQNESLEEFKRKQSQILSKN